jgi:hypothetical protein
LTNLMGFPTGREELLRGGGDIVHIDRLQRPTVAAADGAGDVELDGAIAARQKPPSGRHSRSGSSFNRPPLAWQCTAS